jgi:hypothetical protein
MAEISRGRCCRLILPAATVAAGSRQCTKNLAEGHSIQGATNVPTGWNKLFGGLVPLHTHIYFRDILAENTHGKVRWREQGAEGRGGACPLIRGLRKIRTIDVKRLICLCETLSL